ncbi:MAG: hypothetical protein ACYTGP_00645 [Planctomycetota bacterium]|jgi:hypothetical protein
MDRVSILACGAVASLAFAVAAPAGAQCRTIDFEDLDLGDPVTGYYDGVTFSAVPQSCGASTIPFIVAPASGTSSGTQALGLPQGCPEFSPDILRMVFDQPQRIVTMTVGEQASASISAQIGAWDAGGGTIDVQSFVCGSGIYRRVQFGSATGPAIIKRIDFQAGLDLFECIDDLSFGLDVTPPTARIDSPAYNECVCGVLTITGISCETDGEFKQDMLEYRRVNAPTDPWTVIGTYTSPVCTPDTLYIWNTSTIPHGHYYLRLTTTNECDVQSTDIVSVYVDKNFGLIDVDDPLPDSTVCGEVDFFGTINDSCGACFDHYTVEYGQSQGGPFFPIDPGHPTYDSIVINGTIATWDTTLESDGPYWIKITGEDICGNTSVMEFGLTVQNAGGCGCQFDLNGNGSVDFADILQIVGNWGPCP